MESSDMKKILEAVLFITEQPVTLKMLEGLFDQQIGRDELDRLVRELAAEYHDRGGALELREIAGGWQLATRPEFGPWIRKLFKDRLTYRLSNSAMETLSIIAYKQPIARSEIEEIRGVEVTGVMDTLVERRLIRIVGRKETVGRPLLYGTTTDFLRSFGLNKLEDLPALDSLVAEIAPDELTARPPADSQASIPGDGSVAEVPASTIPENQN
ncbi:MAG TPA: SMC-Scp complex subunit ScpB [Elusimicrobiota bacterium]|nr:SMC-Scp complex subunit ScpB [Elusimicrobiota bacterium]